MFSVKLSSLCARFDALDPNTEAIVCRRLRELFRRAAQLGAAVTVDMEQNDFRELTLDIFRRVLEEEEFRVQTVRGNRAASVSAGFRTGCHRVDTLGARSSAPHWRAFNQRALTGTTKLPGRNKRIGRYRSFWRKPPPMQATSG
jgi:hypothetical protein